MDYTEVILSSRPDFSGKFINSAEILRISKSGLPTFPGGPVNSVRNCAPAYRPLLRMAIRYARARLALIIIKNDNRIRA